MDKTAFIKHHVETSGWAAIYVEGNATTPTFTYTVGFQTNLAQPDVIIIGFNSDLAHSVLHSLYDGIKKRGLSIPAAGGKLKEVIQTYPVLFKPLDQKTIYSFPYVTIGWNQARGEPTTMTQMFLPDIHGLFPGEPGARKEFVRMQDINAVAECVKGMPSIYSPPTSHP